MLIVALVATQGCGVESGGAAPSPPILAAAVATPSPTAVPADALQVQAQTALSEQRYYAPAGDSAIDYYLALRELTPDEPGVNGALTQLQPYLLIASEQALARGDIRETQRLLVLLERVDPVAPALPRLRDGLQRVELARQASETAATVAVADLARMAAEARTRETVLATAAKADKSIASAAVPVAARMQPPAPAPAPVPRTVAAPVAAAPAAPMPSTPRAAPRLVNDAAPRYPPSALKRRIEGYVQVAFTIQPDGRIAGVRVVASTPADIFDAAALAAVARWRFEPTGQSFATQRTLDFRLPKG